MIKISIGIMAYNEAGNIGRLLERLISQETKEVKIAEIVVVASGCTDETENIVREKVRGDRRVKLLVQRQRKGKASAINLFIQQAKSPVLVMISADTLPALDTIEKLVSPFKDKKVGMTAVHIIPVNKPDTFMGYYVVTFWQLHHEVAKGAFKAGEMVAWRNVIRGIDPKTSTDETNITALILQKRLKTVYVPSAIVYNRGPEGLNDFLKARRRHLAAYYHLKEKVGLAYLPPTMDNWLVFKLLLAKTRPKNLKEVIWLVGVILLEGLGKLTAWYDWRVKKEHHPVWPIADSTKTLPQAI